MIMDTNMVNDNFVHDSNYKRIYIKQTMDYKEKYEEVLERAKKLISRCADNRTRRTTVYRVDDIEGIFPELQESEDERIREWTIMLNACVNTLRNVGHSHLAAWLKKQGEQKENATRNKIAEYLKKLILDQSQRGAHMLDYEGRIEEEVDFIINIAKKELEQGKQRPAEWNEENKRMLNKVLECIRFAASYYLLEDEPNEVSVRMWLLDHINPQPKQEWSEKDEETLLKLIAHLDWNGNTRFTKEDCQEATNWLKSLRPQNKWKPSKQ